MTVQAATRPSPHPSISRSHSIPHRNIISISPNSARVTAPEGRTVPPTYHICSPTPPEPRSPSPNYFGLIVEPPTEFCESGIRFSEKWSPQNSIQSFVAVSPKFQPIESNPEFEAFRKQSEETHAFNLSHGNLSFFATSISPSIQTRSKLEKRPTKYDITEMPSPKSRPRMREGATMSDRLEMETRNERHSSSSFPMSNVPVEIARDLHSPDIIKAKNSSYLKTANSSNLTNMTSLKHERYFGLTHSGVKSVTRPDGTQQFSKIKHEAALRCQDELSTMIDVLNASEIIESHSESSFLLLDLRVFPLFSQSRIKGALNLCIPTTLLKRPSFNLQKLEDTFTNEAEKTRFSNWKQAKTIIAYDVNSREKKDAISAINTFKKFAAEGWKGNLYIIKGGFQAFSQTYPSLVDHRSCKEIQTSKINISLGTNPSNSLSVSGGCIMPAQKSAMIPFFNNIRQNQDLIDGVGQIEVKMPEYLTPEMLKSLPEWLLGAANAEDHGKQVSDKYMRLEQEELAVMTKALSSGVSYNSPQNQSQSIRIAGIEKGGKNRYNNIWPYEHSRVKLMKSSPDACDYVNASHIKASRSNKRYIASQGPLPATFEDFWSVIWDQNVRVIVMLTAEFEGGQLKCHSYWTSNNYGHLKLKLLSEKDVPIEATHNHDSRRRRANTVIEMTSLSRGGSPANTDIPHVNVRKFSLSNSLEPLSPEREITQIHYSLWPDLGAPASPSQLLKIVELSNDIKRSATYTHQNTKLDEAEGDLDSPMLVHCSAGCGRTGAFCTIDTVIDMLKRERKECFEDGSLGGSSMNNSHRLDADQKDKFPTLGGSYQWKGDLDLIEKTVEDFRGQRLSMVQSLRQYVLCYEAVLEWIVQQSFPDQKVKINVQNPTYVLRNTSSERDRDRYSSIC
ncbi:BgTH12-01149 [Blumeria graminis f. sp. triticale]|uniref:protein-tyrosine-phosphatase n=5 Tax=Blumeria graminis TaxID=34373 RepID=A0A9X9QG09_BLUGR|nr:BgTH12-01149 [Blumeria graminis f. sp. triticale]VDB93811.1 Bgt-232 [Blumeria graminis f. sp. tritici]